MSAVIVLDTGPLGLLTNPNHTAGPVACRQWLSALQAAGRRVIVPEIADYEIRRELMRANLRRALRFLDNLNQQLEYLPITTLAMRLAADLWAQARNAGVPTAGAGSLDGDVILAAQATALNVAVAGAPATRPTCPGSSRPNCGRASGPDPGACVPSPLRAGVGPTE